MTFIKLTESNSPYRHLEKMSVEEMLHHINEEDKKVAAVVSGAIPQIAVLVTNIVDKMLAGGRLFYIGAGTSGRLGIVDASECVPTFGVAPGLVTGIIAGGNKAITNAVEFAEDDATLGWQDLLANSISKNDAVIGLSASGTAPYVIAALEQCNRHQILTGSISCNLSTPLSEVANFPVELPTGPEFITGSTRMKAGTAQKLALNMISTSIMIKLGRVEDNQMVNMMLSNHKLIDRGVRMVMDHFGWQDYENTKAQLLEAGSVKKLFEKY